MNIEISILTFKAALQSVLRHLNYGVNSTMKTTKHMFIIEHNTIAHKLTIMFVKLQNVLNHKPPQRYVRHLLNEFQLLDKLNSFVPIFEMVHYTGCVRDEIRAFCILQDMISDYKYYKIKLMNYKLIIK